LINEPSDNFNEDVEDSVKAETPVRNGMGLGIYSNFQSTPLSTRSIEHGRFDDSTSDLFKDYLSQENKKIPDTVLEKINEIPDDDSVIM